VAVCRLGFFEQVLNRGPKLRRRQFSHFVIEDSEYEIRAGRYTVPRLADYFINPAANTVAYDGRLADFTADHYRHPVRAPGVALVEFKAHERSAQALSALINTAQAAVTVKPVGDRDHLGGEFGAALGAAALKHIPAGFAGHTLKEAVFAGAGTFLGLVGSFRHKIFPWGLGV
jgi:hypothetical protein